MSAQYYCSPPFHNELPGARSKPCYLVTSPDAKSPGQGVYSNWESVQRVAEGVSRGGGVKYETYQGCLPAWHEGCDAGEHNHPANPANAAAPRTPQHIQHIRVCATPHQHTADCGQQAAVLQATPQPPRILPTPAIARRAPVVRRARYVVSGTGIVHTSLTPALHQLDEVASTRAASLLTTEDSRQAAHFAAGHSEKEAKALADGERTAEGVREWVGGNPPGIALMSDAVRRQVRRACMSDLRTALRALQARDDDSDSEAMWGDGPSSDFDLGELSD